MKILGVIPARGGSKGVPGKNIKFLGGKPLLAYSYEAAKNSQKLDDCILSTDDEEIAEVGKNLGLSVPFLRPSELATDSAPTLLSLVHAIEYFRNKGVQYDAICLLQPTSPFRPVNLIDVAIDKFLSSGADSLVTVLPVPDHYNPHWVFEPNQGGFLKIATGENNLISRRQDLPPAYIRDGSIYLIRTDIILLGSLYGNSISYLINDPEYYVNIDTPEDWKKAEQWISVNKEKII
ncbi:acylneuraminate cytidylyltransferase family protein [Algoriphagus sp. D3-2-R+10]|uniref:acylneuraminate cytidylyltransferase family protein n=1 Tax=Algoriphagus aurantiacus TaxID=3103948 RepID=UPI002B3AD6D4|nr:acylneuraminate cytidylyltransferase family protein [Algoriphagus sp. D3-2-R+10]MEB2777533.1 acylneuraminate cytidylyltransferase family protein [Algoriphagus sp. D3-2-R+10]